MCEQMKELDEDHLEVVHFGTWGGAMFSTVNGEVFETLQPGGEARYAKETNAFA